MSDLYVDLIILFFAWLAYFALHSLLAAISIKNAVKRRFPDFIPYYRLAYNFISISLVIPILWFVYSIGGSPLIVWDGAFHFISLGLGLVAIAAFFWSTRYYDMSDFMGFRQIKAKEMPLQDSGPFTLSPLHRFVRHPWYFLALLILWTRDMNPPFLLTAVAVTIYFIIGSRLEERKLICYYGEKYELYMKSVPGLLPLPWRYLRKEEGDKITAL